VCVPLSFYDWPTSPLHLNICHIQDAKTKCTVEQQGKETSKIKKLTGLAQHLHSVSFYATQIINFLFKQQAVLKNYLKHCSSAIIDTAAINLG
jgi:hypothetical protein